MFPPSKASPTQPQRPQQQALSVQAGPPDAASGYGDPGQSGDPSQVIQDCITELQSIGVQMTPNGDGTVTLTGIPPELFAQFDTGAGQ